MKWKSRPACCMGTMRTVPPLKDGGLEVLQEVLHAEGSGPDLGLVLQVPRFIFSIVCALECAKAP